MTSPDHKAWRSLRAALEVYADPRHWAISRDDLNHRVVSWIGPGAVNERGLPDPMEVAREALAAQRESSAGLRDAGDRLAAAAAQYLDTGRGDLDGALDNWRRTTT